MQFEKPLEAATLIRRYKRFLADVSLDASGLHLTAHCPNPGAMLGLANEGDKIWLRPAKNPKSKLPYAWELTELKTGLVGIDTGRPNRIAEEAIQGGLIPELDGYENCRREVKYGENSRIDLLLTSANRQDCYVEVKNVHLKRNGRAEFPDSKTVRGAKHLGELAKVAEAGSRAVMLYIVQRMDCEIFSLADDIDPAYGLAFRDARARGVESFCYDCDISLGGIVLRKSLPLSIL